MSEPKRAIHYIADDFRSQSTACGLRRWQVDANIETWRGVTCKRCKQRRKWLTKSVNA